MTGHLDMAQLLALRDDDRSEPGMAGVHQHLADCPHCQDELQRLHQRTARLRALPGLAPATDEFPAVRQRITVDRHQRRVRLAAGTGIGLAAALLLGFISRDLIHPRELDAEQQLQAEMGRSQQLERELHAWNPDARVTDGSTAMAVVQLEARIADLDAQLAQAAPLQPQARVRRDLRLWQERVGLMNALVNVQLGQASNVGL